MKFFFGRSEETINTQTTSGDALKISDFTDPGSTPGNVGICLSGGGSRAMCAGMGQLRGLEHLQLNGKSLLSQTRAMSTVSGGSWIGQTFSYQDQAAVQDYLNEYVADLGKLVPTSTDYHSHAETLDYLPDGNPGNNINTKLFSPVGLAVSAFVLKSIFKVPKDMLWQMLIGYHILKPYGLYDPTAEQAPDSMFSFDQQSLQNDVLNLNPDLDEETVHLVARKPFPICNQAMFLVDPGMHFETLAPVQSTPFITGVVGTPTGNDANGKPAGGGGVTSFAFNSETTDIENNGTIEAEQERQWSLTDSVGTSSAFFAETLQNQFAEWEDDIDEFYDKVEEIYEEFVDWLKKLVESKSKPASYVLKKLLDGLQEASSEDKQQRRQKIKDLFSTIGLGREKLKASFAELSVEGLVPQYNYWPVSDPKPVANFQPTHFADGGNVENTGMGGLLAYEDIDRVITFNNTSDAMTSADLGVFDVNGNEIPDTQVYIGSNIPPLFGYQPYDNLKGYRLYKGDNDPASPEFAHSQIFPSSGFADLLQGLWKNSGNKAIPGSNQNAPIYRQTLDLQTNDWYGISGGRQIDVLWVYNNRVRDWYDQLNSDVQTLLGDFDDPESFNNFPNYKTINTNLNAQEINLLSSLTAWIIAGDDTQQTFLDMYSN